MKITCQACQSKYTIADDKIQGKVAKIRCRKCGATVLVDASAGGGANGSAAGAGESWMVSVAEGDQRTMTLQEVIDAYNTGVITGDTYLWKDGMGDWLPLSEVAEIVEALNAASGDGAVAAAPVEDYNAPAADYNPPAAFQPAAPVAARRETARGRGDLFGGSAPDEEVATSAPVQVTPRAASSGGGFGAASAAASAQTSSSGGLTGGRNEQSVLFSLSALTSAKAAPPTPAASSSSSGTAKNDDSGVIDLGALAKAQAAKPAEAAPSPLAAPSPFLFPAALGNVETFQPQAAEQKKKSNLPLIIGGVAVVGILAVVLVVFTGKKEEVPPLPAGAALSAATTVAPEPSATAAPTPTAEASAAPADSSATGAAKATKKATGGGAAKPKPAAAAAAAPATPLPPPKPKSPCGCAAGDLQCQIRCSATGH
jgi:predicted Zn finger-like uncharacterized protein